MRWFSWPAAGIAAVAGIGIGVYLADDVGAMAGERPYAAQRSYASLTPQGERPQSAAPVEDLSGEPIGQGAIYGCTNCRRARAAYDAAERYARDYSAASLGSYGGYRVEAAEVQVAEAPEPRRSDEMAQIDLYARYPITETERELRAIAAEAARDAEARRALVESDEATEVEPAIAL